MPIDVDLVVVCCNVPPAWVPSDLDVSSGLWLDWLMLLLMILLLLGVSSCPLYGKDLFISNLFITNNRGKAHLRTNMILCTNRGRDCSHVRHGTCIRFILTLERILTSCLTTCACWLYIGTDVIIERCARSSIHNFFTTQTVRFGCTSRCPG